MNNENRHISRELIISEWKKIVEKTEPSLKKQLVALYHIIANNGWCDAIFTHCSVRLPEQEAYLFNPFGLMFNEITEESLVKVKFNGDIESPLGFPINQNGATAHTAIYKARPDVNCIIHTHSQNGVAFSNLKCELIGLDQTTMFLDNNVAYHEFSTLFTSDAKQEQLLRDLGSKNCIILRNHGLLAVGESVPMCFWNYYFLEKACSSQLQLLKIGIEINNPNIKIKKDVANQYKNWHLSENDYPGNADLLFLSEKRRLKK